MSSAAEYYAILQRAFAQRAKRGPVAAPRLGAKLRRAADLASLDRLDVGARAKPSAGALPELQQRGGPWLVKSVRDQEIARLRSFWDRPLK
jgi:hypothetical protein